MILKSLADDVEFADLERMFLCFVTRHSCHSFFSTFALKQIVFGSEIKLQSNTKTRTLCISFDSYIKPQLETSLWDSSVSCISFDSYIKPQPHCNYWHHICVVYLLIPTSNHNLKQQLQPLIELYIFWFLHQTTTYHNSYIFLLSCISFDSYIKPQLSRIVTIDTTCCISFDSYIKPQPFVRSLIFSSVVYLLIPTSNHNRSSRWSLSPCVVYLLIPTSNHNLFRSFQLELFVVYLLIPTSNHNVVTFLPKMVVLYIFWFLHQTTTCYRF